MCSTIRPRPGARYFNFVQTKLFWKASTSSSPHKFSNSIVGHFLTPTRRFEGAKCALLASPVHGRTVAISCK